MNVPGMKGAATALRGFLWGWHRIGTQRFVAGCVFSTFFLVGATSSFEGHNTRSKDGIYYYKEVHGERFDDPITRLPEYENGTHNKHPWRPGQDH